MLTLRGVRSEQDGKETSHLVVPAWQMGDRHCVATPNADGAGSISFEDDITYTMAFMMLGIRKQMPLSLFCHDSGRYWLRVRATKRGVGHWPELASLS